MLLRQFFSSTLGLLVLGASPLGLVSSLQAQTKLDMPTPYSTRIFTPRTSAPSPTRSRKRPKVSWSIIVHSNASLIKHPDILRGVRPAR